MGTPPDPLHQGLEGDLLHVECQECGFIADALFEVEGHEHDEEEFRQPPPETRHCTLCKPRPHEHEHRKPVFCRDHDAEDLREHQKAVAERQKEQREKQAAERAEEGYDG